MKRALFAFDVEKEGLRRWSGEYTAGSSGDARIVRCFDGAQHYFAQVKPGEGARAGLRRVENWCTVRDPADPVWVKGSGGTGSPPIIDTAWYPGPDGQLSARRVTFDAGAGGTSGDQSRLTLTVAGTSALRRAASIWVKSVDGSPQPIRIYCAGTLGSAAVTCDDQWRRVAQVADGFNDALIQIFTRSDTGAVADVLVATDPDHCPMLEIGIPASQTAPSEVVAPDRDYGFGAPGVAYFAYENPFTVDTATGVVSDTGARTSISGGGLIVAGAATTINTTSSKFSAWGNSNASITENSEQLGPFNASTIASANGTGPALIWQLSNGYSVGDKFTLCAAVKKNVGLVRGLCASQTGSEDSANHIYLDTSSGNVYNVQSFTHVDRYGVIDCGDYWYWWMHVTKTASTSDYAGIALGHGNGTNSPDIVAGAAQWYEGHLPIDIAMQADAAAVSRSADVTRPRRRLPAAFTLRLTADASTLLTDGDFLTFEGGGFFGIRNGEVVLSDGATERSFSVKPAAGVLDLALAIDEDEALAEFLAYGSRYHVTGPFSFANRYAYVGPLAPVRKLYLWPGKASRPGEFALAAAA